MRDSPATSDTRSCQDTLAASLACYYADASRQPPRPHCKRVAVVAYGTIALCRSCDQMRSAVGRTHSARPLPGAQLHQLITAARAVGDAERHVADAVRQAREAGASWAQIGDALDISRQAAQQRWSAPDNHAGVNRP
ncbi:MAG: hypothetical protein ACRDZY_21830 [Acidimicrobiales bacterium]